LWISTDLETVEIISFCLFFYFLFDFLENLGKKIVILDLPVIMAAFTCLVMPVLFYHFYTKENPLAHLWVKYMPISSEDYFSFMIPAVLALAIGVRLPLSKLQVNKNPTTYMINVRKILHNKPNLGLILIGIGVTSGLLDFLSPSSLRQVFYFMDHLTFVGVFYVIYSPSKHKKIIVPSVLILMIGQALITGMFGELIFMFACALVLILLGNKISFNKKLLATIVAVLGLLIIQSVKGDYRLKTWREGTGADPAYYAQLVSEKVSDPSSILEPNKLFLLSVRMNEGWLIAMTMYKVPSRYDFAYGQTIATSVAATLVPRFIWPDKPDAGGKANLKRFWGYDLVGYSMNIGPFGEGYANFDKFGGVMYMFLYGLFFNLILSSILKASEKRPTLILWLPFLFFYAIGVETDLLTTMGSLIKGLIFTWIVFKIFHIAFRMDL